MRSVIAAALALALGSCTTSASEPTRGGQEQPSVQPVATLAGAWRVAGIDGVSLDEAYGIAFEADAQTIWWTPRCARQERLYRIDGAQVRFTPNPELQPAPGKPGLPVCLIGPPPRLPDVMRALDAATRIERTAQNGVLISGGGHSLTLFSQ
jgi:hypothetical protein